MPGRVENTSPTIEPITEAMIPRLTDCHLLAYADYMNTRLGHYYVESFIDWFRREESAIAFAACVGGKAVGYIVGAPQGYQRRVTRDMLIAAAAGALLRPSLIFEARFRNRIGQRLRLLVGNQTNDHQLPRLSLPIMRLTSICVAPTEQRKGLGDRLLSRFESESRARGMKSLLLSVYPQNVAARRLYERRSWQPFVDSQKDCMFYYLTFS